MSYLSLSDADKKEMLAAIGVSSIEELFCCIPEEIRLRRKLNLPPAMSEPEVSRHFEAIGRRNAAGDYLSFLGGGAYRHIIPYVVDYLSARGEFLSPYTPYQPEVSQGTLQVIFEYQTLISQLTGLDIANASLYDGGSAAAEAVLMASRINGRTKVLIPRALNPQYASVIRTFVRHLPLELVEYGYRADGRADLDALGREIGSETCALVTQSPNFFGTVEDLAGLAALAHRSGALMIDIVSEALSLGLLKAPGDCGADIVTGEAQSFGLPLSYGGPYLGFMACRKDFLRQLPGRLAGETRDAAGERGFTLTFSTREQHIRREKATSNICTNQAWCALRATIFLETLGRSGLREMAVQNVQKAHYALDRLCALRGVRRKFNGPVFNEFVLEFTGGWKDVDSHLRRNGVLGGISLETAYPELKNCVLVCVTETHSKPDIDRLAGLIEEVVR